MRYFFVLTLALAVFAAGCSGGSSNLTPRPLTSGTAQPGGSTATPTPKPTVTPSPTPSPAPSATGTMSVAAVQTAFADAQTYYATLPHVNLTNDLQSLATHMQTSGHFKSATVSPGGISAQFKNGNYAFVFADAPEDLPYPTGAPAASSSAQTVRPQTRVPAAASAPCTSSDDPLSDPNPHEIAFLVNECDAAFNTPRQRAFAGAFVNDGFAGAGYGVDVQNITLDNIIAMGTNHPIDILEVATHGAVQLTDTNPAMNFIMQSTQPVTSAATSYYASDIAAGRVAYTSTIAYPTQSGTDPTYGFTSGFLVENLHFNPGAIVYLHTCFSASPDVDSLVSRQLAGTGAGRYLGWTKSTGSTDDDGTAAFLYDRLLGEQSPSITDLDQFAPQQSPPQRPFPLNDVLAQLGNELRSGPLNTSLYRLAYTYSYGDANNELAPPNSDGQLSRLEIIPLNGITTTPLIEYGLPSIEYMSMQSESSSGGVLQINGTFPTTPGTVSITDGSGGKTLQPATWNTGAITVNLPPDGNKAAGIVQVFDQSGFIGSNAVPLSQWKGTVNYTETENLVELFGDKGYGQGNYALAFKLNFRGDVHPVVETIDASPVPQNLYFPQVEGDSTASVTTLSGQFTRSSGTPPPESATFSLNDVPDMTPASVPLGPNNFIVGAYVSQPSPCNNGLPGPQNDPGNTLCPAFGYAPTDAGLCTPGSNDDDDLCGFYETFTPGGSFGAATLTDPGTVSFLMNPTTYAIFVNGNQTNFNRNFPDGSVWPSYASVTGTFAAPAFPPTSTTSSIRIGRSARSAPVPQHRR